MEPPVESRRWLTGGGGREGAGTEQQIFAQGASSRPASAPLAFPAPRRQDAGAVASAREPPLWGHLLATHLCDG